MKKQEFKPDFKVGDKVRIRTDMVINKKYGGLTLWSYMHRYSGETCIIDAVDEFGTYLLAGIGLIYAFNWSSEMLELIPEENETEK